MGDVLITGPAEEPVSVAELRTFLRDAPDAESVLNMLIGAAREYVEEELSIALVEQTRQLTLDAWPTNGDGLGWWDGTQDGALTGSAPRALELPRSPLIDVETVTTFDGAGNGTILSSAAYFAETGSRPGRLALKDGATWPAPTRSAAGIVIEYRAGYGAAADVPNALKLAILQIAAHWYENRELVSVEGVNKVPSMAWRTLRKFRIVRL